MWTSSGLRTIGVLRDEPGRSRPTEGVQPSVMATDRLHPEIAGGVLLTTRSLLAYVTRPAA